MFFQKNSRSRLIGAHRGLRSLAPENTLLALEKAIAAKADFWEIDVQLSLDDELMVVHDETLLRTSDIAKHPQLKDKKKDRVDELTCEELQMLDAGTWFIETDPFGTIKSKEVCEKDFKIIKEQKISTLEEVLTVALENDFPTNIEIKDHTGRKGDGYIVKKLMELLEDAEQPEMFLISSFNHTYLKEVKEYSPYMATAALDAEPREDLIPYLHSLGVAAYNIREGIVTDELLASLRHEGFFTSVWTVNNKIDGNKLLEKNVKSIITDFPQYFLK